MACNMAKKFSIVPFVLVSFEFLVSTNGEKLVPCYFIFGDSLSDNGNNNNLKTFAKANYPPYGIDFPGGPTGRFTNGRNIADLMAEFLGFSHHIPPFASARGDALLNGVNYASGGAGILGTTGKQFGDVISLDEQLQNHQITIKRILSILGNADSVSNHLGQCIYTVGMGSNDYAAYAKISANKSTPEQFAQLLIDRYSRQLKDLHSLGARKVALFGLGTLGCVPAALAASSNGHLCLTETKNMSGVFNSKLKSLVDVLNKDLVGAKFIYVDTFGIVTSDPSIKGLKHRSTPCCEISKMGTCNDRSATCSKRNDFEFFDGIHPTEATVMAVAMRAFAANSASDAYPCDIHHLAQA